MDHLRIIRLGRNQIDFPSSIKKNKDSDSKEAETFEKIYFGFKINMGLLSEKPEMPMNK